MNFLLKRRWSIFDLVFIWIAVQLLNAGNWIAAILVIVLGSIVAVELENHFGVD